MTSDQNIEREEALRISSKAGTDVSAEQVRDMEESVGQGMAESASIRARLENERYQFETEKLQKQHELDIGRIELETKRQKADNKHSGVLVWWALTAVSLLCAVSVFLLMWWPIPEQDHSTVFIAYLSSVVVEIIAILMAITRYLFPHRQALAHESSKQGSEK